MLMINVKLKYLNSIMDNKLFKKYSINQIKIIKLSLKGVI